MSDLGLLSNAHTTADLPHVARDQDPISVTAIGSCRIVGPMRLMQNTQPVILNQSGVYGYSHSSTELRQHLTHLLNGTRPPAHLMPVISPVTGSEAKAGTLHSRSDYYVFELSSAKRISVEGHPVQLNYLNRHFRDFFSDTARTRAFWACAKDKNTRKMTAFLKDLPEYRSRTSSDQDILRKVVIDTTTPDQLRLDIDAIKSTVPEHLFVTHFDAVTKDGTPLKARADYLAMAREALNECGANWFDPSPGVAAFGQGLALEDDLGSLSHFSHSFEQYLSANWWDRFIAPVYQEQRLDADLRTRIRNTARCVRA